ncbi:MAG: hypothetical protein KDC80_22565 [Saprospiraceae bacterium]|nr:hypothetical protein [Saprospiraceae bacterium]
MTSDHINFRFILPERVIPVLRNTLVLLENHFDLSIDDESTNVITISESPTSDIQLSGKFIHIFQQMKFDHLQVFEKEPLIYCSNGKPDYLGTCAYMVHYLQEYIDDEESFDELARFRYEKSYQYRFSCIKENLVLEYLIMLKNNCTKLQSLGRKNISTSIWASHDIDSLYHNHLPELKTAIWHFRPDQILSILTRLHRDPDMAIFEEILEIDQENSIPATWFWLANNAVFNSVSGRVIENANYQITEQRVKNLIAGIKRSEATLGIHKSLGCSNISLERDQIDSCININRNHYLAGKLPELWAEMEVANIEKDATAGFSGAMGFRNSYGLPVRPFDPRRNHPFNIIEYPLHIMDVTFMNQGLSPGEAELEILTFLRKHKTDCQISVLWHNNYFSDIKYPGWGAVYKSIINYSKQNT